MSERLKTIICGTTFGQYYLNALLDHRDEFQVAGILAKGSDRSRNLAYKHGLPLYTNVEELPNDINLTCVVVRSNGAGGVGSDLVEALLRRGSSVIQEQPVHNRFLRKSWETARQYGVKYRTGNFYTRLAESNVFIRAAKELNKIAPPLYIRSSFCTQVGYPAIEIMLEALDYSPGTKIKYIEPQIGPFQIATGTFCGVPVTVEYHNELCPENPDAFMHLLYSFTFVYDSGRLSLEDTFGPVNWRPRLQIPIDKYNRDWESLSTIHEEPVHILSPQALQGNRQNSMQQWQNAIGEELLHFRREIIEGASDTKREKQEIEIADNWESFHRVFGFAKLVQPRLHNQIPVQLLLNPDENESGVL